MTTLTFEFPTANRAADFLEAVDGTASRSHRVVDVETGRAAAAPETAKSLGGREAPSC
jgi:hypothetical protein